MAVIFQEHENETGGRKYPFAGTSDPVDGQGNVLPQDLFVDAVLYPESGRCALRTLSVSGGTCAVEIAAGDSVLSGSFGSGDSTCELYCDDLHRGTLVLGPARDAFLSDPTPHTYADVPFCTACQFELGANGVSSLTLEGNVLRGDVELSGSKDSLATLRPVLLARQDGETGLRFDAVPNGGIMSVDKTGVRVIHILRQPGSRFGVMDRDGSPYLYLRRNTAQGDSPGYGVDKYIQRSDICRASASVSQDDYAERSADDECGSSYSGGSGGSSSGRCLPSDDILSYLRSHDPQTIQSATGTYTYGFFDIPRKYGFYGGSTMTWFFVEGTVRACFAAPEPCRVAMSVTLTHTYPARYLFGFRHDMEVWDPIYLRPDSYKAAYAYISGVAPGAAGYLDRDSLEALFRAKGWLADTDVPCETPSTEEELVEYERLVSELRDEGYTAWREIYTIRARDYFEHFGCRNWEVSEADCVGDEIRQLVGWGTGDAFFASDSGNQYYTSGAPVPKWLAARYAWWRLHSRRGTDVRHFIVPKERGLVFYTGDYYLDGDASNPKETSPVAWTCNYALCYLASRYAEAGGRLHPLFTFYSNIETLRDRLYREYSSEYDPMHGDRCLENAGYTAEWLDRSTLLDAPRVTSDSLVVQPNYAPVVADPGTYPLGPFEYRYGRLYTPGEDGEAGGYTDEPSEDEEAQNAISAPAVFRFDILRANGNAFNFDVTDLYAAGSNGTSFLYENPIHITTVEGSSVAQAMEVEDPTDAAEVSSELRKLTERATSGQGVELSIPGLGV